MLSKYEFMKILLISPMPPPNGGIGTWTKKYLQHCSAYGIEADIVNTAVIGHRGKQLNTKRNLKDEFVRTKTIFRNLKRCLKSNDYDVVHLNTSCDKYGLYRDFLLCCIVKRKKKKLVIHCRCNLEFQLKTEKRQHIFKKIVKKSDKILVLNKVSQKFANKYGKDKVVIVPNFIEEGFADENFQVKKVIKKVIFVGHVQFLKGFREIYETARHFCDIDFILIGPVKEEVLQLRALPNLIFKGEMEHEKIKKELMQADIFLFPSYTEGFANALLEAMACGLPVIASDAGANADMIEEKGGKTVPIGNAEAIISALDEMTELEMRRQMSEWNLRKVNSTYIIPSVMKQLVYLYSEVIKQ